MTDGVIRHVLWDWNGTLLDDVDLGIQVANALCQARGLGPITRPDYLRMFTFPVIDYYRAVGFDFANETFEDLAHEWIAHYTDRVYADAHLHDGAVETLAEIQARGIGQSILSAHHHDPLERAVRHYGVAHHFDTILGIEDHYAESKLAVGAHWLASAPFNAREVLLIGDTLHDAEVAAAMGIRCVLVAAGHQARPRLEAADVPVVESLRAIPAIL